MARPQRKAQSWEDYVKDHPEHPTAKAKRTRKPKAEAVAPQPEPTPQPVEQSAALVLPFPQREESMPQRSNSLAIENRETWLAAFIEHARDKFAAAGHPLPLKIMPAIGFTPNGRVKYESDEALADGFKGAGDNRGLYLASR